MFSIKVVYPALLRTCAPSFSLSRWIICPFCLSCCIAAAVNKNFVHFIHEAFPFLVNLIVLVYSHFSVSLLILCLPLFMLLLCLIGLLFASFLPWVNFSSRKIKAAYLTTLTSRVHGEHVCFNASVKSLHGDNYIPLLFEVNALYLSFFRSQKQNLRSLTD